MPVVDMKKLDQLEGRLRLMRSEADYYGRYPDHNPDEKQLCRPSGSHRMLQKGRNAGDRFSGEIPSLTITMM
jgi:hypothetical protein